MSDSSFLTFLVAVLWAAGVDERRVFPERGFFGLLAVVGGEGPRVAAEGNSTDGSPLIFSVLPAVDLVEERRVQPERGFLAWPEDNSMSADSSISADSSSLSF